MSRLLRWLLSLLGLASRPGVDRPGIRRHFPTISIPRHAAQGPAPPLHWTACHPSTQRRFKADLTCFRGHGISLKNHKIAADGRVVPSVVCLAPGCDFHEYVRLDEWSGGDLT
jgi:hypothetical protein